MKKYSLEELIEFMYRDGKVTHVDWNDSDYITIKHGEFVDENGNSFCLSPWMLHDLEFIKVKEESDNRELFCPKCQTNELPCKECE